MALVPTSTREEVEEPLLLDKQYHLATVVRNKRTTAPDWHQDVRNFEFAFDDDIQYAFVLYALPSESSFIADTSQEMLQLYIPMFLLQMWNHFWLPLASQMLLMSCTKLNITFPNNKEK